MDALNEQLNRTKELMGLITEQQVEGDIMIQEWVDTWNAFIFDRLDGGYGGPNNIQSMIKHDLVNICPEVYEVLKASHEVIGDVDNSMINVILPKMEEWKENGGDMTTLERPEMNLEKDCPKYNLNKNLY